MQQYGERARNDLQNKNYMNNTQSSLRRINPYNVYDSVEKNKSSNSPNRQSPNKKSPNRNSNSPDRSFYSHSQSHSNERRSPLHVKEACEKHSRDYYY